MNEKMISKQARSKRPCARRPSKTIVSVDQLVQADLVEPGQRDALLGVTERYSVAITPAVQETFAQIPPANPVDGDVMDPVARQYVPTIAEAESQAVELVDPIGDQAHAPMPGLVHRYPDRVLIKATGVCPVYCRFCFRREMVGSNAERPLTQQQIVSIHDYIAQHPEIWEVIISGGDPLVLSNARLAGLLEGLERSPHVRIVRLHSRMPVTQPDRIDAGLLDLLKSTSKTVYVVLHANHANEFSAAAEAACARMIDAGVPMLSQTVLLRGVNDNEAALSGLMRRFVEMRITPYYLHQADLAPGTAHFRVDLAAGQALMRQLRGRYSGLCQPTYVLDLPGGYGKVPLTPNYMQVTHDSDVGTKQYETGQYEIADYQGGVHLYPPRTANEELTDD